MLTVIGSLVTDCSATTTIQNQGTHILTISIFAKTRNEDSARREHYVPFI